MQQTTANDARPGRGMSGGRLALVGVLVAAVALLTLMGSRLVGQGGGGGAPQVNSQGREGSVDGGPAADFTLRGFDGSTTRLSDLRGQVVVLNFWSSWCAPCREEAADLERAWQRYKGRGVTLLGVGVWDQDAAAREFLLEQGITYPNGFPEGGRPVAAQYGVGGIPETFVIDRRGNLVRRWNGPVTVAQLGELIEDALARPG
jgi:cytochrome c biogenesis protein CcmG/thiol:disulfide interchange protein DsbE